MNYHKALLLFLIFVVGCSTINAPLTKTFPDTYKLECKITDYNQRYSPTDGDILLAEQLLGQQLSVLNEEKINQGIGCPTIHKNLNKYSRQYVGFLNEKGEKIIWINAVWHSKTPDYFNDEVVFILDGCSYYWQIEVNLTTRKASNLQINGLG